MFKKKKDEFETAYDRRRRFMSNRLMCLLALGVLVYFFIQAVMEETPMPLWFPFVMGAIFIAVAAQLIWNIKAVREFDREQAELARLEEEKAALAAALPEETGLTETGEETGKLPGGRAGEETDAPDPESESVLSEDSE